MDNVYMKDQQKLASSHLDTVLRIVLLSRQENQTMSCPERQTVSINGTTNSVTISHDPWGKLRIPYHYDAKISLNCLKINSIKY